MENELHTSDMQMPLPNATTVLVLGILSIVGCCLYGTGFILAIIALVLAAKDVKLYNANPAAYAPKSYNNLKAGRICAIIGLVLSSLMLIYIIFIISFIGMEALTSGDPERIMEAFEKFQ